MDPFFACVYIPTLNCNNRQLIYRLTAKCVNHDHFRVRYAFLACIDDMCHAVRPLSPLLSCVVP